MASTISSSLPDQLQNSFRQLTRRIALLTVFRGLGKLLLLIAVLLGAALFSDFLFDWGTTGRTIWQSALGLGALGGVWFFILNPLRKSLSHAELATLIDLHHPELRERLSATVEFSDPTIPEAHKGSALMREYVREETLQSLPRVDVSRSLPTDRMKRALLTGLTAVGILLLPFVLSPQNYVLLWSRLIQPNGNFANASNLYFEIENADRIVARGSNVEIAATPKWRYARTDLPETIWLNRIDEAGNTDRRRLERDDQSGQFVVVLPHVNQDFEYFLTADSSKSESHQIEVKDAPEIFSLEVLYEPPAYTGRPAQTFSTATGRIEAFERSKVVLKPTFNKPVKSIDFAWAESAASIDDEFRADGTRLLRELTLPEVELSPDRLSAEIEFDADIEGPYTITLTDEFSLHNLQDPPRSLQILRDQPPTLALEAGELDRLEAKLSDTLQVPVIVSDDIGIGELELHLTLPDESVEVVSAENEVLGVPEMSYRFRVDLALFNLQEGDVLNWRVRAADERPIPGPNEVWTSPQILNINNAANPLAQADVEQRQDRWKAQLKNLRQKLEANAKVVKEIEDDARKSERENKPFARNTEIKPLAEQQWNLAGQMETLGLEFAKHPLYHEMTDIMQQLAREGLAPLSEQLEQVESQELKSKLDPLRENEKGVREIADNLKQLEEVFGQLAEIEKDLLKLDQLSQEANQLADKAIDLDQQKQELSEELAANAELNENADFLERADQVEQNLDALAEDQSRLTQALKDLLQKRPELINAARQKEIERLKALAERARQMVEPQEQVAQQLEQQAKQSAAQQQQSREDQEALLRDLEKLLADADHQAEKTVVPPLELGERNEVQNALNNGNVEQANREQQRLQHELEQLAEGLKRNQQLPADPKAALEELAQREAALREEIQKNTESMKNQAENIPAGLLAEQLLSLARKQEAVQQALEQLPLPAEQQEARQQAAKQTSEATKELLKGQPQEAAAKAQAAEQQLRELARTLPEDAAEQAAQNQPKRANPQEVARQARELAKQAEQLRAESNKLANEPTGDAVNQKNQELQKRQEELQKQVAALPKDVGRLPQAQAMRNLESAQKNLEQNDFSDAAQNQQAAKEQLEQLAQRAENAAGQTPNEELTPEQVAEQLEQLAKRQQAIREESAQQVAEQSLSPEQREAAQEKLAELQKQQDALAREATENALESAKQAGAESDGTQDAVSAARDSSRASEQLSEGMLAEAAQAASSSAESARQAAEESKTAADAEGLASKLSDFAEKQEQLAEQLSQLAQSPTMNSEAQQQGQSRRGQQAAEISSILSQMAERLQGDPFQLEKESSQASQSGQSTGSASQNLQQAAQNQSQQNSGSAAQQAAQAAEDLKQAAEAISPTAVPDSPVPQEVGEQVADAFKNLQKAEELLKQAGTQQQGQAQTPMGESNGQSQSPANQPGQQADSQNGSPSDSSGEGRSRPGMQNNPLKESAQSLKQAANSLNQANQQMQPGQQGKPNGAPPTQGGQPGKPGQMAGDPGELPPPADEKAALERLELELSRLKTRNWGELPGTLRTEIIQSKKKNANTDYDQRIKLYFEEIARQQSARSRRTTNAED